MLIAVTASIKSAAQINRTVIITNSALTVTVTMFVNEYAESASYMSFDERKKKNEKKKNKEKK